LESTYEQRKRFDFFLIPGNCQRHAPATTRTKLLLEGPILPTLLRLAAPNVLNLFAFAGMITFDGFFLGRIGTNALSFLGQNRMDNLLKAHT